MRPPSPLANLVLALMPFGPAACVSSGPSAARAVDTTSAPDQQLVIMLGEPTSFATAHLRSNHLDTIVEAARDEGVEVTLHHVADGAPEVVAVTPLLIHQNSRGRSIYQGRYGNIPRIRNFMRTSRLVTREPHPLTRADVPVWQTGRAVVATPIKVTAVTGDVPEGFDQQAFARAANAAIDAGFQRFERRDEVSIGRSDRMFYLDIHPHLSAAGLLFISCEIYSQFNCHVPVVSELDEPFVGVWEDRATLLAEVAASLEQQVVELIESAPTGDAFEPVAATVSVVTWSEIGLDLPPAPVDRRGATPIAVELPDAWRVREQDGEAAILFHFLAPLDGYAGEARSVDGRLTLEGGALAGAVGHFEVPIASLTMGDPDLDAAIRGSVFLDADRWAYSRFEIDSIEAEVESLRFGEQVQAIMHGRFRLKDRTIPLDVRTTLEPVVDGDGTPLLLLEGDWSIRLRDPFGIEGPDGPEPAKDTLLYTCRITLEPAARRTEQ